MEKEIKIGDRMQWHRLHDSMPVTVRKIGKRRVTIETDGGYKTTANRDNLSPIKTLPELDRALTFLLAR
jgi:cell division septal protein FtsQ